MWVSRLLSHSGSGFSVSTLLLILQVTPEQGTEQGSAGGGRLPGRRSCCIWYHTQNGNSAENRAEAGSALPSLPMSCATSPIGNISTAHYLFPFLLNERHRFVPGSNCQVITTFYPTPYRAQVAWSRDLDHCSWHSLWCSCSDHLYQGWDFHFRPLSHKNISPSGISLQFLHAEVLKALSTSSQIYTTDTDLVPHFPDLTPGCTSLALCLKHMLQPTNSPHSTAHPSCDMTTGFLSDWSALVYIALLNSWRTSIPTSLSLPHLLTDALLQSVSSFHRRLMAVAHQLCTTAKPQHHQLLPINFKP